MYKRLQKMYRSEMRVAKRNANDKFISNPQNKCKTAWQIIKAETNNINREASVTISPDDLNKFLINPVDITIQYLQILQTTLLLQSSQGANVHPFHWKPFTPQNVCKAVYMIFDLMMLFLCFQYCWVSQSKMMIYSLKHWRSPILDWRVRFTRLQGCQLLVHMLGWHRK